MAKTPASAHIERPKHTAYARAAQAEKPGFWTRFKLGVAAVLKAFPKDQSVKRLFQGIFSAFSNALQDKPENPEEATERKKLIQSEGTVIENSSTAKKTRKSVEKKLNEATEDLDQSKQALDTTKKGLEQTKKGLAAAGQSFARSPEQEKQISALEKAVHTQAARVADLRQDFKKADKEVNDHSEVKGLITQAKVEEAIAHPPGGGFARGTSMANDQAKHASQNRAAPAA
jgi:hypothetical protein